MLLPNKQRVYLIAQLRSNCKIPPQLEDDLIELINKEGVDAAYMYGYSEEDIRRILFHVVQIRTSILQAEAWEIQDYCMITVEDIQSAIRLAIEKALQSFQPNTSKLKQEIASTFSLNQNSTSIVNYIFIWTKKYIQSMLQDFSQAVKVDENGEAISLKQYKKLNKEEKMQYQTIYIDFDEFEVYQTKSGNYKIVRKFEDD